MELGQHGLALLGVVLLVGLFIPAVLERFHVPFASALILVGAVLGPHGLDYVRPDETLALFALLGATFQMLLAGFSAHELDVRLLERSSILIFVLNGVVPGAAGAALGWYFGYEWRGSLLTGTIFMSSSILLVFSFVRHFGLDQEDLGGRLKAGAVVQDLASTLAAFVLLKSVTPHARFPLPILVGLVLGSVATLRMLMPEVIAFAFSRLRTKGRAAMEQRLRFVLALMLLTLFLYSALDVPPVVAAFLVGFSLASIEHAGALRERLHLIGYSLFIPVFLFVVGLDADLFSLVRMEPVNLVVLSMVVMAIVSKVATGFVAGRLVGLERDNALVFGLGSSLKLAVPITATYAALRAGIIGADLFNAVVAVSVVTALLMPLLLELVLRRRGRDVAG